MHKRFLVFLFLLCFTHSLYAQFDTSFATTNILRCADSLTDAFKAKNWEKFTRYSYPAVIGSMGGKEAFLKYVSGTFSQIPDSAWKQYERGKILQIVKTEKDLQALIELHSKVNWQGISVSAVSCLVAESWDGGLFWTFFDPQGDILAAKTIKPDLSNELVIPEKNEKMEPLHDE